MQRLNHPNLVQLYAIVNDPSEGNFLVQEYLKEGNLLCYLRRIKPMKDEQDVIGVSFSKKLEWCVQIARGMNHLELLTIVHRDLAARNILLDKFFTAKVADFGMALDVDSRVEIDEKVPIRWTAPESMFEQSFSHASDVWSYGVLMWEIFSYGDTPYGKTFKNEEIRQRMQLDFERKRNIFRCKKPRVNSPLTLSPQAAKRSKDCEQEMEDVYKIMTKCWDIDPSSRPKFANLQYDVEHYSFTGDLSGYDKITFEKKRTSSIRRNLSSTSYLVPQSPKSTPSQKIIAQAPFKTFQEKASSPTKTKRQGQHSFIDSIG